MSSIKSNNYSSTASILSIHIRPIGPNESIYCIHFISHKNFIEKIKLSSNSHTGWTDRIHCIYHKISLIKSKNVHQPHQSHWFNLSILFQQTLKKSQKFFISLIDPIERINFICHKNFIDKMNYLLLLQRSHRLHSLNRT